ncbi:signal peptidase I [Haloferax larsenii]|uniref:Signal peptidase, endoplasmic reticulum-type n=1 Tax=Haloferax larsenii TaxID=302484 RepID=A0A1H7T997_HALLR|nr:signal peptidase I [Haloferax larsenii]SEL81471.1 signal peptidase, endoplasmic reticulum-type [Haloferax larsenii]
MLRQFAEDFFTVVATIVVISLVVGQLLGQPVLLGYVTSGSMSPTLHTGDAFVAVPEPFAGEIEPGDVIVFNAVELQGGGLTTHRVVEETERGYITKGDNNPFRDQSSDEPVVTEDRIVATALQINGNVIRIPGLGTAIATVRNTVSGAQTALTTALGVDSPFGSQGLSGLFISVGLVLFLFIFVDDLRDGQQRRRDRKRSRTDSDAIDGRWVALGLAFLVLVPANAAMLAPSGTHQVAVDGDELSDDVQPGDQVENGFTAKNGGLVTMLIFLETTHPDAEMSQHRLVVPRGKSATATLFVTAPPPRKQTVVTITERRYFLILPPGIIEQLHSVHPVVAIAAFNVLILLSVSAMVGAVFGFGSKRLRDTSRDLPLTRRLKRLFK